MSITATTTTRPPVGSTVKFTETVYLDGKEYPVGTLAQVRLNGCCDDDFKVSINGTDLRSYVWNSQVEIVTPDASTEPEGIKVGDKVRVLVGNGYGLSAGDIGTILETSPSSTGGGGSLLVTKNPAVKGWDGVSCSWEARENVERVEETTATVDKKSLPIGTRVRITNDRNGHGFGIGEVVTLDRTTNVIRPEDDLGVLYGAENPAGRRRNVRSEDFEVVEVPTTASLPAATSSRESELLARAEKAEKALEDFKTLVREQVIAEAEERGWCSEADEWLESLGLEGRARDPHGIGTVLVLGDGRTVVKADDDSDCWKVAKSSGYDEYLSYPEVISEGEYTVTYEA